MSTGCAVLQSLNLAFKFDTERKHS